MHICEQGFWISDALHFTGLKSNCIAWNKKITKLFCSFINICIGQAWDQKFICINSKFMEIS